MRIQDPSQKEVAFKVTKENNHSNEFCSLDNRVSDEELANFVNRLPRGTGKYKGKLPLKCFNFGKIGHFAAKCPLNNRQKQINPRRNFGDRRFANKQTLFTKVEEEGVSDDEEEDEITLEGRNEILFLAQEKEERTVDLESELIAALEEIENLKSLNEK